jgi:predicted naringenin-chalcone synthase
MAPRSASDSASIQNSNSGMKRVSSESDFSEGENGPIKDYRDYRVRKSGLIGMINWTHTIGTYLPLGFMLGIGVLLAQIVHQVVTNLSKEVEHHASPGQIEFSLETISAVTIALKVLFVKLFQSALDTVTHLYAGDTMLEPAVKVTVLVLVVMGWILRMDNPVFLMSFATFKAPDEWKVSHEQIIEMMRRQNVFTEDSLDFMHRLLARSGTGQATAWPPGIVQCLEEGKKTDRSIEGSRKEAEIIIFDIVEKALKKAKVSPKEIDVLVINCSLFSPTPSLCAMVVSKFNMRSNCLTYNLSGMGCGASLVSIDLAKNMLQRRGSGGGKALVVSTEIITPNLYLGNERAFLLQNTLFRCGGAAMVLSNKWSDGRHAMYKLLHTVREQGTSSEAYNCVYETEDVNGQRGVRLSKEIVKVAGKCMEKNMTTIGPYVLPLTEQFMVVVAIVARYLLKSLAKYFKMWGKEQWVARLPVVRPYVPDFKRGIDHFCIHAGGRAVIDGIEKNMKLELFHTEPSRMALLNYGNTSSSSIWYEMEYIQEHQKTNPLKKGQRIMQVAFGSGFKCTSGVWLKL